MRKLLLSLTVIAGAASAGVGAHAAVAAGPIAMAPAQVQTVQYHGGYGDWRAHEYWRHRRHVEWYRHHGWEHGRHYRGYGS